MDDEKMWTCLICNSQFDEYKKYWFHTNKRKTACITSSECKTIVKEKEHIEKQCNQLSYIAEERKRIIERKEKEIKFLKSLLEKENTNIKAITDSIDTLKTSINLKDDTIVSLDDIPWYNNNIQKNTICLVDLKRPNHERFDHITDNDMLCILNHNDFNDTLQDLTSLVYFHPKAPENFKWCIFDRKAKIGALEFNHETNTLLFKDSNDVVNTNMKNVIYKITGMLEKLEKDSDFNPVQRRNCNFLVDKVGNEFTPDQIKHMKEAGYQRRHLPRAVWYSLNVDMAKSPFIEKLKMI